MKKIFYYFYGFLAGIINGLLGAGGGILTVTSLKKIGLNPKKAHATSVCAILPMCFISAFIYLQSHSISIAHTLPYVPSGIIGSVLGAFILSKISQNLLRKIFSVFVIWAASQLLLK